MSATDAAWSILTKTRGGTVSVLRDLTLAEAKQIYERLDSWFGVTQTIKVFPDGTNHYGGVGRHVQDGDIEIREVFGPPDWNVSEVNSWDHWPKTRYIDVDADGNILHRESADAS